LHTPCCDSGDDGSVAELLVRAHWWLDFSWPQIVALMWAWRPGWDLAIQLWQSLAYAVFVGIAYPVLTIFGVTLLSLTHRFFAVPTTEGHRR